MATIPTKLFVVRNGNGTTDADTTVYPRATIIVYKDNTSKDAIVDTIANANGYQAIIDGQPNPQSRQNFFNDLLKAHIKTMYKDAKIISAAQAAAATAGTSADNELP